MQSKTFTQSLLFKDIDTQLFKFDTFYPNKCLYCNISTIYYRMRQTLTLYCCYYCKYVHATQNIDLQVTLVKTITI